MKTPSYQKIVNDFDIEANTIECDISYRGGILKVDVSALFPNVSEPVMGASQNYLGGGIAGAITGGAMFTPDELRTKREKLMFSAMIERLKRHFYALNNGGGDEYMQEEYNSYERNQNLPVRGY
jgi:hypothetical protein